MEVEGAGDDEKGFAVEIMDVMSSSNGVSSDSPVTNLTLFSLN